jgi:hypothetical protein
MGYCSRAREENICMFISLEGITAMKYEQPVRYVDTLQAGCLLKYEGHLKCS